ncbi:LysR family hydrogen peroxide-inducible transcriptional activator [Litorivivens lipolytica]|uniref:LysR family hydrogen peroxide-inducible transcriptional activator n=1 Tax=Litorivivens lipolytica TaxID=1524264 RepID=A0A7W4Z6Y3_9GAMM|nr:hydrogen peroxide-inducible genes activator [Litorivivens lipolytica]MBB3048738.1 LysR family hydrogen peroxide-inducible transcriptional activator [Litorivivens lipolytica]
MAHRPTLKQLNYLCAVAKFRHFGQAAKSCHVSQPTLSAGIAELEDNLGVTLVERDNKNVLLTDIGQSIVARSQRILTHVDDLVSLAESAGKPFTGSLYLGVIPTIAPFLLPQFLPRFRKKYPECQLFIREDLSANLIERLRAGELDVVLLALPYPTDGLEIEHLFNDEFVLAYYDDHPLAEKTPLLSRDLQGRDVLLLEDGHCLRDHALEACRLSERDVTAPYQATSLNTIVQMVANHIGVTLLPKMAIDGKILASTQVKTRAFDKETVQRSIGLAWRKHSPRREEFLLLGEFIGAQRR